MGQIGGPAIGGRILRTRKRRFRDAGRHSAPRRRGYKAPPRRGEPKERRTVFAGGARCRLDILPWDLAADLLDPDRAPNSRRVPKSRSQTSATDPRTGDASRPPRRL